MALDLSQDYKIWDNRETITYTVEARSGNLVHTINDCKRRALTYKELAAGGGAYTGGDRAWLIPVAVLPSGVAPKIADRVTDAGGTAWTVLEAGLNTLQTWWRLTTRDIVLSASLGELVTFQQPNEAQDQAGGRVPTFTAVGNPVRARIQETEAVVEDRHGKRQAVRKFTMWVGQRVYPSANWRVVDAAGQVYQVNGWRGADRWDILQEIDLEISK